MSRISLNDIDKFEEANRRRWHKELIKKYGRDIAIRTIKKGIPRGKKLKEYMEEIEAEIAKENALKQDNNKD